MCTENRFMQYYYNIIVSNIVDQVQITVEYILLETYT